MRNIKAKLSQPIHISWLIAWLSLGVILGIVLAAIYESYFSLPQAFLILLVVTALMWRKPVKYFVFLALILGLVLGNARGSETKVLTENYKPYYGKQVSLTGKVSEDPAFGHQGEQRLTLTNVKIESQKQTGKIWVSTSALVSIKR